MIFENLNERKIEYIDVFVFNDDFKQGDYIDEKNTDILTIPKSLYHENMMHGDFKGYLASDVLKGSIIYESNLKENNIILKKDESMITVSLSVDHANGFYFERNEDANIIMISENNMINIPARVVRIFNEKLTTDKNLKYISFIINNKYINIYYKNIENSEIYIRKIGM